MQTVAYPRYSEGLRGPLHLMALADGYFTLNLVFVANIVVALGVSALNVYVRQSGTDPTLAGEIYLVSVVAIAVIIASLCLGPCKKIGYGLGWGSSMAYVAAILMGINSALCCGIIGFVVMQSIAGAEIKKYGVKGSTFGGYKKAAIKEAAEAMKASGMYNAEQPFA
jgi:hypothetical protein